VELPGRGSRMREPPATRLTTIIPRIAEAILEHAAKPFGLFGHSMGALLAFEVARQLRRGPGLEPQHLLVAGREAPQLPASNPGYHMLSNDELVTALRELAGTPGEVLESTELMDLLLPTVRADFAMVETYTYVADAPLGHPITAFGGTRDSLVPREMLRSWRDQTTAGFTVQMIEGGHFFLHDAVAPLLRCMSEALRPYVDVTCDPC
jgi:medium-chain acyl-[acyl-carrier-protein] hydrolase